MKKISLVNFIGALIILLMVWVPSTRIFLTDIDFGTPNSRYSFFAVMDKYGWIL